MSFANLPKILAGAPFIAIREDRDERYTVSQGSGLFFRADERTTCRSRYYFDFGS
jgi:hypothetical protein